MHPPAQIAKKSWAVVESEVLKYYTKYSTVQKYGLDFVYCHLIPLSTLQST